jgi:hypothetical protein
LQNERTSGTFDPVRCVIGVDLVDSEFLKERAEHCRALAERADPFIKRRLLDLAARYDGRFDKRPSYATLRLEEYLASAAPMWPAFG